MQQSTLSLILSITSVVIALAALYLILKKKNDLTLKENFTHIPITGKQLINMHGISSGRSIQIINISPLQTDNSVDILFATKTGTFVAVFDIDNPRNTLRTGKEYFSITFSDEFLNNLIKVQPSDVITVLSVVEKVILDPHNIISMKLITTKALN